MSDIWVTEYIYSDVYSTCFQGAIYSWMATANSSHSTPVNGECAARQTSWDELLLTMHPGLCSRPAELAAG